MWAQEKAQGGKGPSANENQKPGQLFHKVIVPFLYIHGDMSYGHT